MIVCVCHRVSDRHIACAVRDGCASFEELQEELRVGTGCGACRDCARDTFEQHFAKLANGTASARAQTIHFARERRGEAIAAAAV